MYHLAKSLTLLLSLLYLTTVVAKSSLTTSRLNMLSGAKGEFYDTKSKWDERYKRRSYVYGKMPAKFLAENYNYLRAQSSVLDMGVGEGRNAVFLAQKGHKVTGIDISSIAIKKAHQLARENKVKINTILGSMDKYPIKENTYDAIICFYYVDHSLNEKMLKWLKPGGILIYESYNMLEYNKKILAKHKNSEKRDQYLKQGELLNMFPKMRVLKYEEPLHESHFRASIILKKEG